MAIDQASKFTEWVRLESELSEQQSEHHDLTEQQVELLSKQLRLTALMKIQTDLEGEIVTET